MRTTEDESIDVILDEALAGYHTEMNARVDNMLRQLVVGIIYGILRKRKIVLMVACTKNR